MPAGVHDRSSLVVQLHMIKNATATNYEYTVDVGERYRLSRQPVSLMRRPAPRQIGGDRACSVGNGTRHSTPPPPPSNHLVTTRDDWSRSGYRRLTACRHAIKEIPFPGPLIYDTWRWGTCTN